MGWYHRAGDVPHRHALADQIVASAVARKGMSLLFVSLLPLSAICV